MTRRVLVTGGAGFIGSHVAEAFRASGDDVTVLDDLTTGRRENVAAGVRLVEDDVRSSAARELVASGGFDVLCHHAAQIDVRKSVDAPAADAAINVVGLLNLLEGARTAKLKRVVFASSGGTVYGEGATLPVSEPAPKLPAAPYGTAKLTSEYYLATFGLLYGIETVSLRYSNVYGPRQDPFGEAGVVAIFSERLLRGEPLTIFGDGEQTRDMVFVGDVAAANVLASRHPVAPLTSIDARAFNIGTGVETSVNRLATQLAAAAGRQPELRHAPARAGEILRSCLDVSKAARELGWKPRVSLAEGLASTFRWFAED